VTYYDPQVDPANVSSAAAVTSFDHYRAYKNRGRGAWMRGANLRLSHALLADNDIGATFAANETFLQDSVIIGESANNATTLGAFPIRGYEFYDGRVGAERVQFVNYASSPARPASAYGYNRHNAFSINTQNFTDNATADSDRRQLHESDGLERIRLSWHVWTIRLSERCDGRRNRGAHGDHARRQRDGEHGWQRRLAALDPHAAPERPHVFARTRAGARQTAPVLGECLPG
jgi:hypothetical protein